MSAKVTDSRFYMWRALFAIAHADEVITSEERNFMNKVLDEQPFTDTQREILKLDIEEKQNIRTLFDKISDQQDRSQFFHYARTLVWADGDFGEDEKKIMLELKKMHVQTVDFATFETDKGMALADDYQSPATTRAPAAKDTVMTRILRALSGT